MKKNYLLLIALFIPFSPGLSHAQELDGEAKKKLALAGAAVVKAIHEHDISALEKVWSPKLLVNSPGNRVLDRAEVFEAIKAGKLNYEDSYKSTMEKIEFYGNVAVTMGEDTYIPDFGPEKGKLIHRRSTNVWQYSDGAWMLIARQATIYDPEVKHY